MASFSMSQETFIRRVSLNLLQDEEEDAEVLFDYSKTYKMFDRKREENAIAGTLSVTTNPKCVEATKFVLPKVHFLIFLRNLYLA